MRTTVYFHKEHSNVQIYTTSHFLLNDNRILISLLLEESNCNQKELQRSPVFLGPICWQQSSATITLNNQPNNYPKSPTWGHIVCTEVSDDRGRPSQQANILLTDASGSSRSQNGRLFGRRGWQEKIWPFRNNRSQPSPLPSPSSSPPRSRRMTPPSGPATAIPANIDFFRLSMIFYEFNGPSVTVPAYVGREFSSRLGVRRYRRYSKSTSAGCFVPASIVVHSTCFTYILSQRGKK